MLTWRLFQGFVAWCWLAGATAWAEPPAAVVSHLRHGVNITGWFRFPGNRDPAALSRWMTDAAMRDLHQAGFDFVRLAADPDVVADSGVRDALVAAVCRLQRAGLAVILDAHPTTWHLESGAARLHDFWRDMAPALRRCDSRLTVPEIVNEPVFPDGAARWAALQHAVLLEVRAILPESTILLTGADWGSIRGLVALTPEADPNVIYSFHFYDPPELTSLAAWHPDLDRAALAQLPFPVTDRGVCTSIGDGATAEVARDYCAAGWDEAAIARRVGQAAAWARDHHVRLLAGEFGASAALNPATRLAWLRAVRASLDAEDIGWALWGYDDLMGFAVPRPLVARPVLDGNVLVSLGLRSRPGRLPPDSE